MVVRPLAKYVVAGVTCFVSGECAWARADVRKDLYGSGGTI
ncbi:MAG: hypothetical protein QXX56_05065 [Candidatus Bathyarchaeia archaeon]